MNGTELKILIKQFGTESKYSPGDIIPLNSKEMEQFFSVFRNLLAHRDPISYSNLDLSKLVKPRSSLKKWNYKYFSEFFKKKTEFPDLKDDKTLWLFYNEYTPYEDLLSIIQLEKEEIMELTKNLVRKIIFDYLQKVPLLDSVNFLRNRIENLIDLSIIPSDFREDLTNILSSMLNSEDNSILLHDIKDSIMKIYYNLEEEEYNIILLKFLDILVENSNTSLRDVEKLQFFKYLVLLKEITQKDIDNFYEFIDTLDLKTNFRPQIEDDE